ncbi:MAG: hypothetical protein ACHBN1_17540 [Heteroscytonema crispum UTEX LB 1556]
MGRWGGGDGEMGGTRGTRGRGKTTTNHQPRRGSPVAWVGKPYQGRPFTTNHQPPTLD